MKTSEEIFLKINGFENYAVSNLGRVVNIKSGRSLKPFIDKSGYLRHCLCENNKRKYVFLHRLIAIAFIDNPKEKPCVNHIDEDKLNNSLDNLEWCTIKENNVHGARVERASKKCFKSVIQLDLDGNALKEFESLKQAEQETGALASHISSCCSGERKSAGGYKWKKK
ncbi:HNH endonuclease [Lactococcus phage PLgY-30]|uniref:HNH endonuclease n=2 Tax=Uwajimavirus PLgW1 TaxID=2845441 RepID=A0A2Z2P8M2_9CAUD|nr:HNH endonuclease [Lactococcus phage PLgY-16]ASJ80094.1 HNH endonuclease [Lactococcus phage PLgY-30]